MENENLEEQEEEDIEEAGEDTKEAAREVAGMALKDLQSAKFTRYLEKDAKISVPEDYYDEVMIETYDEIKKRAAELEKVRALGRNHEVIKIEQSIKKIEKVRKNLVKSTVSGFDELWGGQLTEWTTVKTIIESCHGSGVKTANSAAIISGSVSIVKNVVAVTKGETRTEEAVRNVAVDTGSGVAVGYVTGFSGSAIKSVMQSSASPYLNALSKTSLAGTLVTLGIATTRTLKRYYTGEINGLECFEELGENGAGMVSAAMFATVGQAVIPVPVVGGLVGGMVGYAISSASYSMLMGFLKEEKLTRRQRQEIERVCEEHVEMIRGYRSEIQETIDDYLSAYESVFEEAISTLENALLSGDIDTFMEGAGIISEAVGRDPQFTNREEFDELMNSDKPLRF